MPGNTLLYSGAAEVTFSYAACSCSAPFLLVLQVAMSLLQKAYPAEIVTRLLPVTAPSGMSPVWCSRASLSSDSESELEADGSSISDSSDDCEMLCLGGHIATEKWAQQMPYPTGGPSSVAPAMYYNSWIQEFWKTNNKACFPPQDKHASRDGNAQPWQPEAASGAGVACLHLPLVAPQADGAKLGTVLPPSTQEPAVSQDNGARFACASQRAHSSGHAHLHFQGAMQPGLERVLCTSQHCVC